MKLRLAAAGAAIGAAAIAAAVPGTASAEEFPRNGIMPPGNYHIIRHPSNVVGSALEHCVLQVFPDARNVVLACGATRQPGQQTPAGPDNTNVSFAGQPFGLALRDIDPRMGHWIGTQSLAGTPIIAPYPLAGVTLQRR